MIAEWKKKWVDALRSGEYEQTRERLRNDAGFCCLGVLCDVVDSEGWQRCEEVGPWPQGDGPWEWRTGDSTTLPNEVWTAVELEDDSPKVEYDGKVQYLHELNDSGNYAFEQLADLIEEQL